MLFDPKKLYRFNEIKAVVEMNETQAQWFAREAIPEKYKYDKAYYLGEYLNDFFEQNELPDKPVSPELSALGIPHLPEKWRGDQIPAEEEKLAIVEIYRIGDMIVKHAPRKRASFRG